MYRASSSRRCDARTPVALGGGFARWGDYFSLQLLLPHPTSLLTLLLISYCSRLLLLDSSCLLQVD